MLVLKNCRLVTELTEGYDGEYADIAVENGIISGIYSQGGAPEGESVDMGGKTVLPGLFDLHMHLNFDTMDIAYIGSRRVEQSIVDGLSYAQDYLRNGYTFVRDCGMGEHAGQYVRQMIEKGLVKGPHYIHCGACNTPPTAGNAVFGPIYKEFTDPEEAEGIVREDLENGASFVKYMVSGAMMNEGGDPQAMICTEAQLKAMADAAKAHGTYLSCHVHGKPGILACLDNDVYTLEHCSYLDEECIEKFLEKKGKCVMIPTVGIMYGMVKNLSGDVPEFMSQKNGVIYDHAVSMFGKAYRAGVKIGWGSDLDRPTFDMFPGLEFMGRTAFGLSNVELLKMATIDSAEIVHMEHLAGTIKVGKWADFCVVDGKPDEDISAMYKLPAHVFKMGEQIV